MVNGSSDERLYNLLPAIYRIRDAEQGEPLRALMAIMEQEFQRLERDMDDLYADWFIESCAEWVVPYIGDLLGVRNLHTVGSAGIFSLRAYVANTLRYRRRKGTAPVLEQLARDVTGWPARAVEFFERLATNQHVNHVRLHSLSTPDLRRASDLERLGGPFEEVTHTAEVRHIAVGRGRYNIANLGLFLWRLQPYFVVRSTPQPVADPDDGRYTFSALGNDMPLFNRPQTETEITHLAEEINVPDRLRRWALYDDLAAYRAEVIAGTSPDTHYFGKQPVLQVFFDHAANALAPEEILICDLSGWEDPAWTRPISQSFPRPDAGTFSTQAAVDPVVGRLVVLGGVTLPDALEVSYVYGFSSEIGGGPYPRQDTLATATGLDTWSKTVDQTDPGADFATFAAALADWAGSGKDQGILTVTDSATYGEDISISLSAGQSLVIQAAGGQRPLLRLLDGTAPLGELVVTGGDGNDTSLTLNGLLMEGAIRIEADSLEQARLVHCTLVPGRGLRPDGTLRRADLPSVKVDGPNSELRIHVRSSILGPLHVPETLTELSVQDSIVGAPQRGIAAIAADAAGKPGPKTLLERVTVFGPVSVRELALASETIFTDAVTAQRRQSGCTRFCFVPSGSRVPRRYRCQPDLALEAFAASRHSTVDKLSDEQRAAVEARVTPTFTSVRYGDPGFSQLSRTIGDEIRTGAEDGAEMGVFQHLKQPQREANLRTALEEYLRFGLEAGIFHMT
jgi:hypothetical protein